MKPYITPILALHYADNELKSRGGSVYGELEKAGLAILRKDASDRSGKPSFSNPVTHIISSTLLTDEWAEEVMRFKDNSQIIIVDYNPYSKLFIKESLFRASMHFMNAIICSEEICIDDMKELNDKVFHISNNLPAVSFICTMTQVLDTAREHFHKTHLKKDGTRLPAKTRMWAKPMRKAQRLEWMRYADKR